MSQEELANALGVSRQTMVAWEKKDAPNNIKIKIAEILDVPVISFFGDSVFNVEIQTDTDIISIIKILKSKAKSEDLKMKLEAICSEKM